MNEPTKLTVRRRTAPRVERTPEELAELRAARERFQRDKPTLKQILGATGQKEAIPLGDYLHAQELLQALRRERERQQVTLAQLADRTGYDPAVLSRLLTGRQANTTLATVGRIAHALGKEVVHTLRDLPAPARAIGRAKKSESARATITGGVRITREKAAVRQPAKRAPVKKA
jgi:transcriptional regulator with XRE-family HTH domain